MHQTTIFLIVLLAVLLHTTPAHSSAVRDAVAEIVARHAPPAAAPPPPALAASIRQAITDLFAHVDATWADSSAPPSDSAPHRALVAHGPNAIALLQPHLFDANSLPTARHCGAAANAFAHITGLQPHTSQADSPTRSPSQDLAAWHQAEADFQSGALEEHAARLRTLLKASAPDGSDEAHAELRRFHAIYGIFALSTLIFIAIHHHDRAAYATFLHIVHAPEPPRRPSDAPAHAPSRPTTMPTPQQFHVQMREWWTRARPTYAAVPTLQDAIDAAFASH